MEKVIIQTCVKKETAKGVFYTIELSDGRKGISSDDLTQKMGMEIELEVKEGKPFQNQVQYYFNLPKSDKPQSNGKFASKDWTFEKRKASLELSINWANGLNREPIKTDELLKISEVFFTYLNKKV